MRKFLSRIGPGPTIAAAFIGPGTVTVCSLAGAQYGTALLWALLFSVIATAVLQETAARLGLVTQAGLAINIKRSINHPVLRWFFMALVVMAIVVGSIAYESGNIRGGSLGVVTLLERYFVAHFEEAPISISLIAILLITVLAGSLLMFGRYEVMQRALLALVVVMSVTFVGTAVLVVESWADVLSGLLVPSLPEGSIVLVVALIGTTIVPYNLFLHSDLVRQKWRSVDDMPDIRFDTLLSIGIGGLISAAIVICAAAIPDGQLTSASDLALGLSPLLGDFALIMIAVGLFAAGLTSAITAPIAATLVLASVFNWSGDLGSFKHRLSCLIVLLIGTGIAALQINAIELIKIAQFANGLVLPFAVVFLWYAANQTQLLGEYVNRRWQNVVTLFILFLVLGLGLRGVLKAFA